MVVAVDEKHRGIRTAEVGSRCLKGHERPVVTRWRCCRGLLRGEGLGIENRSADTHLKNQPKDN